MTTHHDSYKTMRALGKPRGLTSHVVGRILLAAGLRSQDGMPALSARAHGLAEAYDLGYGRYGWKWHEEFVSELLDEWLDDQQSPASKKKRRGA